MRSVRPVRTTVVNVRTAERWDVYVGRGWCPKTGRRFDAKAYGNPFPLDRNTPASCMAKYLDYLDANPGLVQRIKSELPGKVLGCWCKPGPCHGDVLAAIANGKTMAQVRFDWADLLADTRELF